MHSVKTLLPPPSWAMCVRQHTAREIRATKGQLPLQMLELFWESEWWFMLANWFISRADKHLFFFVPICCNGFEKTRWKTPLLLPQWKDTGRAHNNSSSILEYIVMQFNSTSQSAATTISVRLNLKLFDYHKPHFAAAGLCVCFHCVLQVLTLLQLFLYTNLDGLLSWLLLR